jgi:hypothetical protein
MAIRERAPQPQQPPKEALTDLLKSLPTPITITQHLDTEREKIFYRYQVGEPTPENPVGPRMGATPNFLDAVKFSLEVVMRQGKDEH